MHVAGARTTATGHFPDYIHSATPSRFLEIGNEVLAIALFPFESTFSTTVFFIRILEIILSPFPLLPYPSPPAAQFLTSSVSGASRERSAAPVGSLNTSFVCVAAA